MIVFCVLLALVDTFLISQISFWGIVPTLFVVVVYMFRKEATFIELVLAASVYGFVISIFQDAWMGLLTMIALVLATVFALGTIKLRSQTRLRIRVRGYDAILMSAVFTAVYWLISAAPYMASIAAIRTLYFILGGLLFNLCLMLGTDLIHRKRIV